MEKRVVDVVPDRGIRLCGPPPPPPPHLVLRKRLFFSLSLSSLKRRRTARAWGSTVFNEEKEDEIEERGWGVGGEGGGQEKGGKNGESSRSAMVKWGPFHS